MKKTFIAVLMGMSVAFTSYANTQDLNKTVATVNGEAIKEADLQAGINSAVTQGAKNDAQLRENVLNILINQDLLIQQAKKEGVDSNPQVQERLKEVEKTILMDYALQKYLEKNPISETEVKKDYDTWAAQFAEQKEIKIRHILLKDEAEAKKVLAQLRKNKDGFTKAAEKSEDVGTAKNGGELGNQLLQNLIPEIRNAVENAKQGLIDKPIKSEFGWHIIDVQDPAKAVTVADFETVAPQIRQQLTQQAIQRYVQELRDAAKIERSK